MTVRFKESFVRDLRNIKDKGVLTRVRELIELVEQAQHLGQVANLKKLRGGGTYYRIRVGDYRISLAAEGDVVTLVITVWIVLPNHPLQRTGGQRCLLTQWASLTSEVVRPRR